MNRIKPEDTPALFDKLHMTPSQGKYLDEDKKLCCVMGAYIMDHDNTIDSDYFKDEFFVDTVQKIAKTLCMTPSYVLGVMEGWDDDEYAHEVDFDIDTSDRFIGQHDGVHSYDLVTQS